MLTLIVCLVWLYAAFYAVLLAFFLAGAGVRWFGRQFVCKLIPEVRPTEAEPSKVPFTAIELSRRREALQSAAIEE